MKAENEVPSYKCVKLTEAEECGGSIPWERIAQVELVDTVTGEAVRESTQIRACWTASAWYVQFRCKDHYAVSDFENRDDPLYEQDVVELFIDEEGNGTQYIEVEVSPFNVVFDARISWEREGVIHVDTDWDLEGLETRVVSEAPDVRTYELCFPLESFARKPQVGTEWRVNFYRIDEQDDGEREYQAWGPTGAVNYHLPSRFGRLLFV
ncbi:hypothetical protein D3C76_231190 [compost metagenome]